MYTCVFFFYCETLIKLFYRLIRRPTKYALGVFCLFFLEKDDLSDKIDLIFCIGGDKSLLCASSLFLVRKL